VTNCARCSVPCRRRIPPAPSPPPFPTKASSPN